MEGDGDSGTSTPGVPTPTDSDSAAEDDETGLLDTPVPCMAWQACIFGVIASMGGFIVGYSTGRYSIAGKEDSTN